MYEPEANNDLLLQGDIIKEYPFSFIPKVQDFLFVRKEEDSVNIHNLEDLEDSYSEQNNFEEQMIVNSRLTNIILLSQSCDVQRRETIMIAPVYSIEFLKTKLESLGTLRAEQIDNKINALKNSRFEQQPHYFFYLPGANDFPESYIDFNSVLSVSIDNIDINDRILSLNDKGRHWLSYKLSHFFGRPLEFN